MASSHLGSKHVKTNNTMFGGRTSHSCTCVHVYASGWKTARVAVHIFPIGHWVGWGGILTFIEIAYSRDLAMPLCRVITGWVGWGGILTSIVLAYSRDLAMPLCRVITGWVGAGVGY